jgi:hypothetical protein
MQAHLLALACSSKLACCRPGIACLTSCGAYGGGAASLAERGSRRSGDTGMLGVCRACIVGMSIMPLTSPQEGDQRGAPCSVTHLQALNMCAWPRAPCDVLDAFHRLIHLLDRVSRSQ